MAEIFFIINRLGLTQKQSHIIILKRVGAFEKKIKIRKKFNFFFVFFDTKLVK
jgi:hypothetical protein